jgi:hypothetical protein
MNSFLSHPDEAGDFEFTGEHDFTVSHLMFTVLSRQHTCMHAWGCVLAPLLASKLRGLCFRRCCSQHQRNTCMSGGTPCHHSLFMVTNVPPAAQILSNTRPASQISPNPTLHIFFLQIYVHCN